MGEHLLPRAVVASGCHERLLQDVAALPLTCRLLSCRCHGRRPDQRSCTHAHCASICDFGRAHSLGNKLPRTILEQPAKLVRTSKFNIGVCNSQTINRCVVKTRTLNTASSALGPWSWLASNGFAVGRSASGPPRVTRELHAQRQQREAQEVAKNMMFENQFMEVECTGIAEVRNVI